ASFGTLGFENAVNKETFLHIKTDLLTYISTSIQVCYFVILTYCGNYIPICFATSGKSCLFIAVFSY
ncbi:hypothetical protein, partial [Fusobacterium perfoetens]|uniref:hypothetical protein n=1 Tax=Fusobacterium perfoetens TaxID=852 RepID=UPI0026E9EA58